MCLNYELRLLAEIFFSFYLPSLKKHFPKKDSESGGVSGIHKRLPCFCVSSWIFKLKTKFETRFSQHHWDLTKVHILILLCTHTQNVLQSLERSQEWDAAVIIRFVLFFFFVKKIYIFSQYLVYFQEPETKYSFPTKIILE